MFPDLTGNAGQVIAPARLRTPPPHFQAVVLPPRHSRIALRQKWFIAAHFRATIRYPLRLSSLQASTLTIATEAPCRMSGFFSENAFATTHPQNRR